MLATVSHLARSLSAPLFDFIFPRACLNCQQLLNDGQRYVCVPCWDAIERVHPQHPLFSDTKEKLLASGTVSDLVSCFVFQTEGTFQRLAHAMKYEGFERLGVWLGRELGKIVEAQAVHADFLIPIPLHRRKFRERGYNQAEIIARGVSEVMSIPVRSDVVRRWRFTETQTKLNIDQRQNNMEDAFEIIPGKEKEVDGKICMIVDDVITTGATIHSCAAELISAGASQVIAASLALAQ
ncbi:MAG: ComF family protein [Bacteroidota bacterium]